MYNKSRKALDIDAASSGIIYADPKKAKGGKTMAIYLISSILAVVASAFFFFDSIIISSESACPLILIGLSIFQAVLFKSEKRDYTNTTNYSLEEIDFEAVNLAMQYHALTKIAIIPLLCVFMIYFNPVLKIAIPMFIYLLSFLPIRFLVSLNRKKNKGRKGEKHG